MNDIYLLLMFFSVLAIGNWTGQQKKIPLAKSVTTLLSALLAGIFAVKLFHFGDVLQAERSQIAFLQQILFLLFICATGYQIGPDIARLKFRTAWRGIVVAFILAVISFGISFVLWKLKWADISELIGITAGGVTQTAILEIAKNSLETIPDDFEGKVSVAFAITYLVGTAVTIVLCRSLPPLLFRRNLVKDAEAAAFAGKEPHPSSKNLLLPERQARVFRFAGATSMSAADAAKELAPVTLQGVLGNDTAGEDRLEPGTMLVLLADRCQLAELPQWVGEEVLSIPLETAKRFQYVSQSVRLRGRDACSVREFLERCREIVPCLYIEQITRDKCAVDWRDPAEELRPGDVVKLFCRREEISKLDDRIGVVIPKKADTDLVTLGVGIALGIAAGSLSFHGFSLGSGLCVLLAGIFMGWVHEKNPRMAGFPPQAVQLFSDFGLLGFLTLSGLSASQMLVNQILNSGWGEFTHAGGRFLACGLLVTCIPLVLTMLIGYWLFDRNIAVLAFALAGSRSANPTEKELEKACGKKAGAFLAGSAFMIPYACANIFLTSLGILIAKLF